MSRECSRILEYLNYTYMFREYSRILEYLNFKDVETMKLVTTATMISTFEMKSRISELKKNLEVLQNSNLQFSPDIFIRVFPCVNLCQ